MTSPAKQASKAAFDAANTRHFSLKLNTRTDADIIAALESSGNIQGEAKRLIRLGLAADRKGE